MNISLFIERYHKHNHNYSSLFSKVKKLFVPSNNKYFAYFDIKDLDNLSTFTNKLNSIESNYVYSVYVKVRYSSNNFFMAGNNFGFAYNSKDDVVLLLYTINSRLEGYFAEYNISGEVTDYIQVSFTKLTPSILS